MPWGMVYEMDSRQLKVTPHVAQNELGKAASVALLKPPISQLLHFFSDAAPRLAGGGVLKGSFIKLERRCR